QLEATVGRGRDLLLLVDAAGGQRRQRDDGDAAHTESLGVDDLAAHGDRIVEADLDRLCAWETYTPEDLEFIRAQAERLRAGDRAVLFCFGGNILEGGQGLMGYQDYMCSLAGNPALVRAILLPGLLVWFLVDSAGSLISGGGINVIGNLGFLILFGVPLVAEEQREGDL
ncbi:MAG TPA: hypothetical protein PLW10_25560, partial [Myxococcota bacterium]|nr:hypothetical protein [Myxococcota bacterium]